MSGDLRTLTAIAPATATGRWEWTSLGTGREKRPVGQTHVTPEGESVTHITSRAPSNVLLRQRRVGRCPHSPLSLAVGLTHTAPRVPGAPGQWGVQDRKHPGTVWWRRGCPEGVGDLSQGQVACLGEPTQHLPHTVLPCGAPVYWGHGWGCREDVS